MYEPGSGKYKVNKRDMKKWARERGLQLIAIGCGLLIMWLTDLTEEFDMGAYGAIGLAIVDSIRDGIRRWCVDYTKKEPVGLRVDHPVGRG